MNDKVRQYRGLSCAAWGYFFLNFHFRIGSVNLLPGFVGFLFLLGAIGALLPECRNLLLLRPLCIFFAAMYAVDWVLAVGGQQIGGHILFFDLLVTAAELYFHFQFLTDIAALAKSCLPDGAKLAKRLFRCRTLYTLLSTAVAMAASVPAVVWPDHETGYSENQGNILLMLAVAGAGVSVAIMVTLFQVRKCFRDGDTVEREDCGT